MSAGWEETRKGSYDRRQPFSLALVSGVVLFVFRSHAHTASCDIDTSIATTRAQARCSKFHTPPHDSTLPRIAAESVRATLPQRDACIEPCHGKRPSIGTCASGTSLAEKGFTEGFDE